jgi:MFS family permease
LPLDTTTGIPTAPAPAPPPAGARRDPDVVAVGRLRFSYAWLVIATLFCTSLIVQGIMLAGITVFDGHLLEALQVSRGALKLRDSIFLFSTAIACLLLGTICEWLGVRRTMVGGLLLLSASMLVYSTTPPLWGIYLLHAALGVSLATAHVVMIMIVLSTWFATEDPRRGIALGIAVAGASCGAVIMSQLIAAGLQAFPYPTVFRLLAAPGLLLVPVVALVVRPPRRDGPGAWNLARGRSAGEGFRQALRTVATSRVAALLAIAVIPIFYVSACIAQHTVLLLRDQGLSLQAAAAGVGTMFVFGLVGKVGSGFVLLRLPLARTWLLFLALMFAGSLALWLFPRVAHGPAIALIGLGWGGCFPLTQLWIAARFPGPNLARVLGIFILLETFGSAAGAWLTGVMFDRTGSYALPLAVNAALLAFSCAISLASPPPARPAAPLQRSAR